MALDAQRNWNILMAESRHVMREDSMSVDMRAISQALRGRQQEIPDQIAHRAVHLPDEIIILILEFIVIFDEKQKTLAACCHLSRQWYNAAVVRLYEAPMLYGKNFEPFVRTICPSINLHIRKSPLSDLIKALDLGALVHQGSKSITARLLGRTKSSLETFRAPQSSFAINCLPALAKCTHIRLLDLSLVSESPPLPDILKTVVNLPKLKALKLPRSSGFGTMDGRIPVCWSPVLQDLTLSGGIDAYFLAGHVAFPSSLRSLTIEHCPLAKDFAIMRFLRQSISQISTLRRLKICFMPRFEPDGMDALLGVLPQLQELSISVDYITVAFFEGEQEYMFAPGSGTVALPSTPGKLQHDNLFLLELTNSGNPSVENKVEPMDIVIALDDDILPALRIVRIARSLMWHDQASKAEDTELLTEMLVDRNRRDWENRQGAFSQMSTAQWQSADPSKTAGVWLSRD